MSVLQYALHYLEVERVVLCGHYGCGGVQAALSCPPCRWRRSPRRWLAASASCATPCITKLRRSPMTVVLRPPPSASTDAERSRHALDALVEANVRAQFARLLESEPVQTVLASGRPLSLHGCVYDLASGHLTTLVEHLSPQEHAP
jgi:carbonic anhydrase